MISTERDAVSRDWPSATVSRSATQNSRKARLRICTGILEEKGMVLDRLKPIERLFARITIIELFTER